MSPPKKRKTAEEKRREEVKLRQAESAALYDVFKNTLGDVKNFNGVRNDKSREAAEQVFGNQEVQRRIDFYRSSFGFSETQYTSEELAQIRLKVEENLGLRKPEDGDDLMAERASLVNISEESHARKEPITRAEEIGKLAKRIVCGGVAFDCNISKSGMIRNDLMNQIAKNVSGSERTPSNIAADILPVVQYHLGDRLKRTGRDIRKIDEEIKEVYNQVSDYMEEVHGDLLPDNHRDHFGVFAGILAVTSNGATACWMALNKLTQK
jgi:hypothetical protein